MEKATLRGQEEMRNLRQVLVSLMGAKCKSCGATDELEIDHILPVIEGGGDEPSNLQILCQTCHVKKHTNPNPKIANHSITVNDILWEKLEDIRKDEGLRSIAEVVGFLVANKK